MKDHYNVRLRCVTCGCDDQFESNEDQSYIKCTFCNREYLGGIEELKELNIETFEEVKEQIREDASTYIHYELIKMFRGNKYIKFK